jgi:hypothetical protein
LDGETNLKIRQALPKTAELTTVQQLNSIKATIECELPNRKVNEFTGTLQIGDDRLPLCIYKTNFIHSLLPLIFSHYPISLAWGKIEELQMDLWSDYLHWTRFTSSYEFNYCTTQKVFSVK